MTIADLDPDTPDGAPDNQGDAPEPEAEEVEGAEPEEIEGDEAEADEPEMFDYEEGGKKYRVPVDLKSHLLRQADYTRKTQEVAEAKRALEADREAATAWRKAEETVRTKMGETAFLNAQLAEFDKIDWARWFRENPQAAQAADVQRRQLERQRDTARAAIEEANRRYEAETQQSVAKRLDATRDYASKNIAGWTPARDNQILELTEKLNVPPDTRVAMIERMSPQLYELLNLAVEGAQARETRAKAKTIVRQSTPAPEPTTRSAQRGGGASAAPTDSMSIERWMRERNKQAQRNMG